MQIIAMLFTGAAPLYLMSTTYVLVGALLGCPMGAEFKAALEAAWQVDCNSHNNVTTPLQVLEIISSVPMLNSLATWKRSGSTPCAPPQPCTGAGWR